MTIMYLKCPKPIENQFLHICVIYLTNQHYKSLYKLFKTYFLTKFV